jgi:hypothetical protein
VEAKVKLRLVLAILAGVIIIGLIYFVLPDERFIWRPTFSQDGDQPYDLSLLKNTLSDTYGESFQVVESIQDDSTILQKEKAAIIYVGDYEEFDSLEASQMKIFARNGGVVFMSSRFEHAVMRPYLPESSIENPRYLKAKKAKRIYARYQNSKDSVEIPYIIRTQNPRYDWIYFDTLPDIGRVEGSFTAIGERYTNLISIEEGAGKMIFHTNPLIFTNFHLRNDPVFEYTNELIASMEFDHIYWFEPSFILPNSQDPIISESPLRFILSQPSLRWAWYLILFLVAIFVWNGARRRQRAIKVENLPENETALYLDTVTRFYKKTGSHMHIVRSQLKLLNRHLNNRYRINFTNENEEMYREAEIRLGIPRDELKKFYSGIKLASQNTSLSDQQLLEINQKIKTFYSKCP